MTALQQQVTSLHSALVRADRHLRTLQETSTTTAPPTALAWFEQHRADYQALIQTDQEMDSNSTNMEYLSLSTYDEAVNASESAVESVYSDLPTNTTADNGIRAGLADIKDAETGYLSLWLVIVDGQGSLKAADTEFLKYLAGESLIQKALEAAGVPRDDLTVN